MGRVSSRKINPEVEERVFEIFRNYVAHIHTPQDVKEFLLSLLSPTEQVMIAKRLAIAVLLTKGYNYESIDHTLKVSKSTVTTVHKQMTSGGDGYKKAVERILRHEGQENLWNKLETLVIQLSLPKSYGSPAWQRKSQAGKNLAKRKRILEHL